MNKPVVPSLWIGPTIPRQTRTALVILRQSRRIPIFLFLLFCFDIAALATSPKTVKVGLDSEPRTLDPRYAIDANSQQVSDLCHCGLVRFDESGRIIPAAAKNWKWTDKNTLTLELNEGVKFNDGSTLSPEDVKATFLFFKKTKLKNPTPLSGTFQNLKEVSVKSNIISFKLSDPDASFLQNLAIGILPVKLANSEEFISVNNFVGCGAFQLADQAVNQIKLTKNPNYTLGKVPKVDIEIKIVKDEQTRYAKLRKGELDIVQNTISREKLTNIAKSNPNLAIYRRPALDTAYLGFNMRDSFLSKKEVRQAIAYAINREEIITYILKGMAEPASTILTSDDPFLNKSLPKYHYDPDKANKLLDQAGYKLSDPKKNKIRFQLSYKTTTDQTRISIAQAIASQLSKVGIKINIQSLEWGKFKADVESGQVQLWSLKWIGFKDPDIYRYAFSSESFPPNGANRGWYSNKKVDELLAKARGETDVDARKKLYQDVQSILSDELPYVFLWHEETFAVVNKALQNFHPYADNRLSSLSEVNF